MLEFLDNAKDLYNLQSKDHQGLSTEINFLNLRYNQASNQIANGELKPDGWLVPSSALLSYTNSRLVNLGAPHANCTELFSTPTVAVINKKHRRYFNPEENVFSWDEVMERAILGGSGEEAGILISLGYGHPRFSATGLSALIQLAAMSNSRRDDGLTLRNFEASATLKRLSQYESLSFDYPWEEAYLLQKIDKAQDKRIRFALTTEQAFRFYNNRNDDSQLIALFPREGSVVSDYLLCVSQGDWVTTARRIALENFSKFLLEKEVRQLASELGFQLSDSNLVSSVPQIPVKKIVAPSKEVVGSLIEKWNEIRRPSAVLLVLDLSASMEGEALYSVQAAYRDFLAAGDQKDKVALISFATNPKIESDFSSNRVELINKLNGLQAIGGSGVYDALKFSVDYITAAQMDSYRRSIVFFTDGGDNSSHLSRQFTADIISDRFQRHDLKLYIVGSAHANADFYDLKELASAANGTFIETSLTEMSAVLHSIFREL